jgi:hypothetical protein
VYFHYGYVFFPITKYISGTLAISVVTSHHVFSHHAILLPLSSSHHVVLPPLSPSLPPLFITASSKPIILLCKLVKMNINKVPKIYFREHLINDTITSSSHQSHHVSSHHAVILPSRRPPAAVSLPSRRCSSQRAQDFS